MAVVGWANRVVRANFELSRLEQIPQCATSTMRTKLAREDTRCHQLTTATAGESGPGRALSHTFVQDVKARLLSDRVEGEASNWPCWACYPCAHSAVGTAIGASMDFYSTCTLSAPKLPVLAGRVSELD